MTTRSYSDLSDSATTFDPEEQFDRDIESMLSIDQEVLAILGKTAGEIAEMGLHEFAALSYSKGIVWTVERGGRVQGLTVSIKHDQESMKG
jgi:hypothetical protein